MVGVTVRRWASTTLAMALVGAGLLTLAPDLELVRAAVAGPQALADSRGPDSLVVLLAWALAALTWAWGVLGLLLTGLGTLPGVAGQVARVAAVAVVPATLRRAAAVAVGLSLVAGPAAAATGPAAASATVTVTAASTEQAAPAAGAPDWPGTAPATEQAPAVDPTPGPGSDPVPDWPDAHPPGAHVVVRGDTLWHLASDWLVDRHPGSPPSPAAVAAAVHTWWQTNADVIGADPDLLLPGQVLLPPAAP
ncbi:hypothetical protein ASG41_01615 [Modestobacter sp. Leaf380]|nr:hypothetical protein ASG41_01615 [Modestobacter sp. Leaf380]